MTFDSLRSTSESTLSSLSLPLPSAVAVSRALVCMVGVTHSSIDAMVVVSGASVDTGCRVEAGADAAESDGRAGVLLRTFRGTRSVVCHCGLVDMVDVLRVRSGEEM